MKKIIQNWQHKPGVHCASTAISDVMTFNGQPLSEAMCFGLGSGLGFAYLKGDVFNPSRMIAVRSRNLEPNFFAALGIPFKWATERDPEKALQAAKEYIDQDIPVLMKADIRHLPYYNTKNHFPGHVICMWGYDDEEQNAYVADTERLGLIPVPYESLKKARSTSLFWYPLTGEHFPARFSEPLNPLSVAIERALIQQADDLDKDDLGGQGLFGFRAMNNAAREMPEWGQAKDWQWCFRWAYQVIEKRGTGGAAFRRLYARFLEEANEVGHGLVQYARPEHMHEIARKWSELAEMLKEISEQESPRDLEKAAEMLRLIRREEKAFFLHLLEAMDAGCD